MPTSPSFENAQLEKGLNPGPPPEKPSWTKRLGPLAPVALLLAKLKGFFFILLKLKFLLSFALFLGVYWALFGPWFGVGVRGADSYS